MCIDLCWRQQFCMKGMFDGVQKSQNLETHKHICYISKFNGMLMVFVCMYKIYVDAEPTFPLTPSHHSHLQQIIQAVASSRHFRCWRKWARKLLTALTMVEMWKGDACSLTLITYICRYIFVNSKQNNEKIWPKLASGKDINSQGKNDSARIRK